MENDQGNPDTGSNDDFFNQLEAEVNGQVSDQDFLNITTESNQETGPPEETQPTETANVGAIDWDNEDNPYKKRYSDSSREAQKMKSELDDLKPFIPVLDVMKQDSGLVDHVRQYLLSGGAPAKSVQDETGVGPDFQYNEQEALTNPDSDSAKVLNSHVDKLVEHRVGKMIQKETEEASKIQKNLKQKEQEADFKKKHNMDDDQFTAMVEKAKSYKLSLEDVYFLVNKQKNAQNVADATRKDVLNQMQNVRSIPTSNSSINSAGTATKSKDDQLFDSILGSDGDLDSLFG